MTCAPHSTFSLPDATWAQLHNPTNANAADLGKFFHTVAATAHLTTATSFASTGVAGPRNPESLADSDDKEPNSPAAKKTLPSYAPPNSVKSSGATWEPWHQPLTPCSSPFPIPSVEYLTYNYPTNSLTKPNKERKKERKKERAIESKE